MIDFKLSFQGVLFINAKEITPNSKVVSELVNEFSDFELLPSTFQEISNDGATSRINMKSQDGELEIRFGASRIDIEKSAINLKGDNLENLRNFSDQLNELSAIIYKILGKKASRISIISNYLLDEMSEERLNEIYSKVFHEHPFHSEKPAFEWNSRMVSSHSIELGDIETDLNVIHSLNRIKGTISRQGNRLEFDRINLKFDINTKPTNDDPRFTHEHAIDFFVQAAELEDTLKEQLIEFIS